MANRTLGYITKLLTSASRIPPAATLPSWPAVLEPIACIRMKFSKSSSCAIFAARRPAIGNALMPAAPMSGLRHR